MKFRQQCGSLDESMATCVEIEASENAIRNHLHKVRTNSGHLTNRVGKLKVEPYSHDRKQPGSDPRIGWDKVYVVLEDGCAIGFTDGPLDGSPEIILGKDLRKPGVYDKFVAECKEKDIPHPPGHLIERLEHHWLVFDKPGLSREYMVAQWSPSVLCWYRSNEFATHRGPIAMEGWKWLAHVPLPDTL